MGTEAFRGDAGAEFGEWRDTGSAPKDGSTVLLSGVGSRRWIGTGHWFRGAWRDDGPGELSGVTHWMPLPDPPSDTPRTPRTASVPTDGLTPTQE